MLFDNFQTSPRPSHLGGAANDVDPAPRFGVPCRPRRVALRGPARMLGRLATVWRFRHFWLSLAGMDLRVRYRRSVLGIGWSLLHPVVMTVVFCVAFASWLGNGDWRTAAPFYLAGLAVWDVVKHSAVQGSLTFLRNEPYIRQSPIPLAVYTLRTSLGTAVHFGIALCVSVVATAVLHPADHATPFYALWAVVPAVLLL